jgi:uncharacterized membrane protein YfcA
VDVAEAAGILAVGVVAGAINAVVGAGTLVTFPVLLAFGYPPVAANASNTVGVFPGAIAGAYGYRAELAGRRHLLLPLGTAALLGGAAGAALLLFLPAAVFRAAVPALICLAVILVVVQPWLARALRRSPLAGECAAPDVRAGASLLLGVFATGVYGGYFGAAQGVLLLGLLGVLIPDGLQRLNGIKNVLAATINAVAALVFIGTGHVAWPPALLIAIGSIAGGLLGGRYGRRLPDAVLRAVIVAVGLTAILRMVAH